MSKIKQSVLFNKKVTVCRGNGRNVTYKQFSWAECSFFKYL